MSRAKSLCPKTPECLLVLYDPRYPEAEERLQREVNAWCGFAYIERLTVDSAVLIIRPGAATELAA